MYVVYVYSCFCNLYVCLLRSYAGRIIKFDMLISLFIYLYTYILCLIFCHR